MPSEAQRKATKKYREKMKRITVDFYPTELDLWEHIQAQDMKQTYIKDLIRVDMTNTTKDALTLIDKIEDECNIAQVHDTRVHTDWILDLIEEFRTPKGSR